MTQMLLELFTKSAALYSVVTTEKGAVCLGLLQLQHYVWE
jgi:hypothetical protein